jgi:hypothetical protein
MGVVLEVEKEYLEGRDGSISILLKDKNGERELPMFLTIPGSVTVAAHLEGFTFPRPHVYDLLKEVITGLGAAVVRVELTGFDEEGVWQARLYLSKDGGDLSFQCKSGDAIAISLEYGVPIVIEEELFSRTLDEPRVKNSVEFVKRRLAMLDVVKEFGEIFKRELRRAEGDIDRSKLD